MEEKNFNIKQNIVLIVLFIIVTLFHVIYASLSQRAAYLDGAMIILTMINDFLNSHFRVYTDINHTRFFTAMLAQLPMLFSYIVLGIKSKYALSVIYSLGFFALPPLILWLNYYVAKRAQRMDIFVISFFFYGAITILSQIFAISELGISVALCFLLLTYLAGKLDYKPIDIISIIILVITLFGSHEYILFVGFALFIASLFYANHEENLKNRKVKYLIGISSLFASMYVFGFILFHPGTQGESINFLKEFHDYLPHVLQLNTLLSIITVVLTIALFFYKQPLTKKIIIPVCALYALTLLYMLNNLGTYLQPMWELHTRSIPCWATPLIILLIVLTDIFKKRPSDIFYSNLFSIALICAIAQTGWQITHTYWWNQNINYMLQELDSVNDRLYIPQDHQEISSFFNPELRRYIWYYSYAATSILFSKDYEIKTLLVHYNNDDDPGNKKYRDYLYKVNDNKFSIPTTQLTTKNKFWDATEVVEELDKYNQANNIPTQKLF